MACSRIERAEIENYNRVNRLLVDVAAKVLRKVFEAKATIHVPSVEAFLKEPTVKQRLTKLTPKVIKQHQANLIYPTSGGTADIEKWDVTLLCAVIKNVCNLTCVERNVLDKIREIRNAVVGHSSTTRMPNADFIQHWTDVTSHIDDCLKIIGDQGFENDITATISSIRHDKSLDPLLAIVATWEKNEELFVETAACRAVELQISTDNIVTVAGVSGSGKSAIAHHAALRLAEEGYTIYPVNGAEEILQYADKEEKQVMVLDDPVGKHEIDFDSLKQFEKLNQNIDAYIQTGMKIIVSCRKNIVNHEEFKSYKTVITECVVDLSLQKYDLSENEKNAMFISYVCNTKLTEKERKAIIQGKYSNFPLLCKVFGSNLDKYDRQAVKFFREPFAVILEELDTIKQRDKHKYCALNLCLMFEKGFNTDCWDPFSDTSNDKTNKTVAQIMNACGLRGDDPFVNLINAFKSLTDVYFIQRGTTYIFIHDALHDAVAFLFGRDYPREMLRHCSSKFILEHVRTEEVHSDDEFVIRIHKTKYKNLAERLCKDLQRGHFHDVFLNPSLRDECFIESFCTCITRSESYKLRSLLFNDGADMNEYKSVREETEFTWSKDWFIQNYLFCKNIRVIHWLMAYNHYTLFRTCCSLIGGLDNVSWETDTEGEPVDKTLCIARLVNCACISGNIKILHTVLHDIHTSLIPLTMYKEEEPALHMAALSENPDIVDETVNMGFNIDVVWKQDTTPLWLSSALGLGGMCNHLLQRHGSNVNLWEENGVSPLYIAARNGHVECVSVLLKHGSNVNLCTESGASPLYIAAHNGHVECVSVLLKHGSNVNLCRKSRVSPLYIAAHNGHVECVSVLLKHGSNVNLCKKSGASPLFIAAETGHVECVSVLLKHGSNVNLWKESGASPLYIAAQNGHIECVSVLLKHGSNVNLCTESGVSPLYIAAQTGHVECVSVLLKHGSNVNLCEESGASPLYIAAQNGHVKCVSVLLKHGSNVNLCEESGASPLYIAAHNGHVECVSVLLKHGADVNARYRNGATPLFQAAMTGHVECVSVLLKHESNVHACVSDNASPLFIAARNGHTECVSVLLQYGANANLCRKDGTSPLAIASHKGHQGCISLLETLSHSDHV